MFEFVETTALWGTFGMSSSGYKEHSALFKTLLLIFFGWEPAEIKEGFLTHKEFTEIKWESYNKTVQLCPTDRDLSGPIRSHKYYH